MQFKLFKKTEIGVNMSKMWIKDYRVQVGFVIFMVVFTLSAWGLATRNVQSTNNAIVQCDIIDVVSEVNGVIDEVIFTDDQWVDQGDEVIKIEDSLFFSEWNRAKSALSIQESNYQKAINDSNLNAIKISSNFNKLKADHELAIAIYHSIGASIEEAKRELKSSLTDLIYLEENYQYVSELFKKNAISDRDYRNSKRKYESQKSINESLQAKVEHLKKIEEAEHRKVFIALENITALKKSKNSLIKNSKGQIETAKGGVSVAIAESELAKIMMKRTVIIAKRAGHITNRRTSRGDYIEVGQPIASIVSCEDNLWIQANFKETQVGKMEPGKKAEIIIDTYPDKVFTGKVESISSGSGSIFSVLPPENASGNFTKVVKRMPVKIVLDDTQGAIFRIGSSAYVKVYTK
jgi:membrane fusion protein (multidrug efflux system)